MLDEKYVASRLEDTLDKTLMKNEEYLKCRDDLSAKTKKVLIFKPQNDEQFELYNDYENALAEFEGVATQVYLNSEFNIELVRTLLQHSSVNVTQRYIGVSNKMVEDALADTVRNLI